MEVVGLGFVIELLRDEAAQTQKNLRHFEPLLPRMVCISGLAF